jgi:PAS domain-containing protein
LHLACARPGTVGCRLFDRGRAAHRPVTRLIDHDAVRREKTRRRMEAALEDRARSEQRAIQALRESEAQWKEVFEHNPVMYFMVDADGIVHFWCRPARLSRQRIARAIGAEGLL